MPRRTKGSGTIYRRGGVWWVLRVNGAPVYESSKSTKKSDAVILRDKLLAQRHRGEITGGTPDKILIDALLDDVVKSDIEETTRYIWKKVVEKNIRPFFGNTKAARLSTDLMDRYRVKRRDEDGVTDATVNRELSILRTAFHNARKRTPPKVNTVPYFPMVKETTVRKGFLTDEQYDKLRDSLPQELKVLFVCGYETGIRFGELIDIRWSQVDFESGLIVLDPDETKNRDGRQVPILEGDMEDLLLEAKKARDDGWPDSEWVFNRQGTQVKDIRGSWRIACIAAGVPELNFHDLRRTAVRNMRRAGVPQVIRMKISGHKTDSMERRYNIVDADDINIAKEFMERRRKSAKTL